MRARASQTAAERTGFPSSRKTRPRWLLLVLWSCALLLAGCVRSPGARPARARRESYRSTITSYEQWRALEAAPGLQATGNLACVKVVVDLHDRQKLYFVDGKRYPLHSQFVRQQFGALYGDWNKMWQQYVSDDRRLVLATLVYYRDADLWSFELQSEDNLSAEGLRALYRLLREATFFGAQLRFRSTSQLHDQRVAQLAGALPLLDEREVFAKQRFQPVQQGRAIGILRLRPAPLDPATIQQHEIVVTDDLPLDLPPSAALITERLQTPLSHVAVLSANRGTPDMALRGALREPNLTKLKDRWVELHVSANSFTIREHPAPAQLPTMQPLAIEPPNLEQQSLTPLCELTRKDSQFAGAKAANLGEVCPILGEVIPAGFVVPFAHFVAHLKRNGLYEASRLRLASNAPALSKTLADLRARIAAAPVDDGLLAKLEQQIGALSAKRVRLRSSTSAEDLPGFNGAGLYDSEAVSSTASRADLGAALARVWASVFNLRAYQERARYGIDHDRVAMAVLVQRSIDDGSANGVAISQNPFDRERPALYINAQRRGGSVTGAQGDKLPEQWLVRTFLPTREPERVASSNDGAGAILERAEVIEIASHTEQLHAHFKPSFDEHANAVDVEWVLSGGRTIHVVQVRPYRVRWPDP